MAGIGFELKKLFAKKGLFAKMRAYTYAGIVCAGPMILGLLLLIGLQVMGRMAGADQHSREVLNSMITYTLLFSLISTNTFSLVTTRYTADMLFTDQQKKILPSFFGSVSILLIAGEIVYGIFLHFAGIPFLYQALCLILFGELVVVWTEIDYLTAIKDFRGIILTFAVALLCSWSAGLLLTLGLHLSTIPSLFLSVCFGYGIMLIRYFILMIRYFPTGQCSCLAFLKWLDEYPQLICVGLCVSVGLFSHLFILWCSRYGVQVQGLFYGAPTYDIPALLAFFSILATTINFVTSVEVNFYPKYRNYFSLFNDAGSLKDIEQAQKEMNATLVQELTYTYARQFFVTIVFIVLGTMFLPYLPLGLNEDMLGIYRMLCMGYAFYSVGNCAMLIELYFNDYRDAAVGCFIYMLVTCIVTVVLRNENLKFAGVGFLAGGIAFTAYTLISLRIWIKHLMYHVLCSQPVVAVEKKGFWTKIASTAEQRYQKKYWKRNAEDALAEDDTIEE